MDVLEIMGRGICFRCDGGRACGCKSEADCFDWKSSAQDLPHALAALADAGLAITKAS